VCATRKAVMIETSGWHIAADFPRLEHAGSAFEATIPERRDMGAALIVVSASFKSRIVLWASEIQQASVDFRLDKRAVQQVQGRPVWRASGRLRNDAEAR